VDSNCFLPWDARNTGTGGVTIFPILATIPKRSRRQNAPDQECSIQGAEGRGSMVTTTRSAVFLSAVVAAALGLASQTSGMPVEKPSATAQVEQRFPLTSEMFTPVPITFYVAQKFDAAQKAAAQKARRQPMLSCASTPNGWPYVSQECVVAANGTNVTTFTRS
jgi:hypothetical protein